MENAEMKIILKLAECCCKVCCFPTDFDHRKNTIIVTRSNWKYYLVICQILVSFFYLSFTIVQMVNLLKSEGQLKYIIFHSVMICIQFLWTVIPWISVKFTKEFVDVFGYLMKFQEFNGSKLGLNTSFKGNASVSLKMLKLVIVFISAAVLTFTCVYLAAPNNIYYLYYLFPDEHKNIFTYLIYGIIIEGRLMYQYNFIIVFTSALGLVYCQWMTKWIVQIRKLMKHSSQLDVRNFDRERICYGGIQIMATLFNKVLCEEIWLPSLLIVITVVFPMSIYGIIKMGDRLDIISFTYLCVAIPTILFMNIGLYLPMIAVNLESTKLSNTNKINQVLEELITGTQVSEPSSTSKACSSTVKIGGSLSNENDKVKEVFNSIKLKYIRRTLGSCRPIRCQMCSLGVVDRKAKQKLLTVLFDLTIYLLLTF